MKRDINNIQDDIIEMKRLIKRKLIADPDVLEALNNPEIEDSPDEFLDVNIFGFIRVPQTQDTVKNFICFAVNDIEPARENDHMKKQYIQINCICHLDDIKTKYGMDRHDLISYLVRDIFNWTNEFGLQFKLIVNEQVLV